MTFFTETKVHRFKSLHFYRSSITRLSLDDKALRTKEVSSQERDLLIHKALVPETIPEKKDCVTTFTVTAAPEGNLIIQKLNFYSCFRNSLVFLVDKSRVEEIGKRDDAGIRAPGYSPPIFEDKKSNVENENQEVKSQDNTNCSKKYLTGFFRSILGVDQPP